MKKDRQSSNLLSYTVGFLLSLIITLAAYIVATKGLLPGWNLTYAIIGLAVTQLWVQVTFFLHIMEEERPRLNLLTFTFMVVVVMILVIGSLWIMKNLDYNMMPHHQDKFMLDQYFEGGF